MQMFVFQIRMALLCSVSLFEAVTLYLKQCITVLDALNCRL